MIDARLSFKQQVEHAVTKASAVRTVLSRFIPNVGGPKQNRRALLASVVTSVITYGIAIWAGALQTQETCRKVTSVGRLSALRVASAYRTVYKEARAVIAGLLQIEVIADEWKRLYRRGKSANTNAEQMKDEERQSSLLRWQQGWDKADKGRWTYRLIPHLDKWISRRYGSVNYYLTQMLSGHGCFRAYLYKHKYEDSPECPTCSGLEENAEHVFFAFSWFNGYCCEFETTLEQSVKPETLAEVMLSSNEAWKEVTTFVTKDIHDLRREDQQRNKLKKT